MTVAAPAAWLDLIHECLIALVDERGVAVTGAALGSRVIQEATRRGMSAPAEFERTKFKVLLSRLQDVGRLVMFEKANVDVLLAPPDRPHLLTETVSADNQPAPGIRRDLFAAFTLVTARSPWYEAAQDRVIWTDEGVEAPLGAIAIPRPTYAQLAARVREFSATRLADEQVAINGALSGPIPLAAFSKLTRERGWQPQWQEFRTRAMTEEMHAWALANGLTFQSSWLTSASDGTPLGPASRAAALDPFDRTWRRGLTALFGGLDRDDLARISIPLDIVLRLMSGKRN